MRTSEDIRAEIDFKHQRIKEYDTLQYRLKQQIRKLENTYSKAVRKEALDREGITVTITECEAVDNIGPTVLYHAKTKEGASWLTPKRFSVGAKTRLTPHEFKERKKGIHKGGMKE